MSHVHSDQVFECPEAKYHGNPFRYCRVNGCGWMEEPVVTAKPFAEQIIERLTSGMFPIETRIAYRAGMRDMLAELRNAGIDTEHVYQIASRLSVHGDYVYDRSPIKGEA